MFDSRDPHEHDSRPIVAAFLMPESEDAMPIPDVYDYIQLGMMAPEPVDNDQACPHCERVDGHETDCSEAPDYGPRYRDYYSAAYRHDFEEHRR